MSTAGTIHLNISAVDLTQKVFVQVICTHPHAYIEKACCRMPDSDGLFSCACGGQDQVVCPNIICQGIDENEVDQLFDRLAGDREEDLT